MNAYRYPTPVIYADYLRAAFGLGITLGPLLLLDLARVIAVLFAVLALLFAWFALRTALRQASRIELSPEAIALHGPIERRLRWRELSRVKLAYYGPRRARERGWLQLTLRASGRRPIRVDSTLEGFDQVMHHVQDTIQSRDLPIDATTSSNLAALDLEPGPG